MRTSSKRTSAKRGKRERSGSSRKLLMFARASYAHKNVSINSIWNEYVNFLEQNNVDSQKNCFHINELLQSIDNWKGGCSAPSTNVVSQICKLKQLSWQPRFFNKTQMMQILCRKLFKEIRTINPRYIAPVAKSPQVKKLFSDANIPQFASVNIPTAAVSAVKPESAAAVLITAPVESHNATATCVTKSETNARDVKPEKWTSTPRSVWP